MNLNKHKSCTVCKGETKNEYMFKKIYNNNNSIIIYKCLNCKNIYLGDYSEEYDDSLYSYYSKYVGKSKNYIFDSLTASSYIKVLELLKSFGTGKKILDVGCGTGGFVSTALDLGYEVNGIELSQTAVEIANEFDLPVKKLDFFSTLIEESSYDILTMFEILEHLPDPIKFLIRAEKVVRPGGLIYLTTPNFNSIDRRLLGENWNVFHHEHLSYFTTEIIVNAIKTNTKLEILKIETRNISNQLIEKLLFFSYKRLIRSNKIKSNIHNIQINFTDNRKIISNSRVLSIFKNFINFLLNKTGTGTTIVMVFRRPMKTINMQ